MSKRTENKIREALGRKSRQLKTQNQALVYMAIAKKLLSFSELLNETKLSRASLTHHLKLLENEDAVYKDIIKPIDTLNRSEIGKIVYKVKADEMEKFLMEAINTNFTIADLVEDENYRQELNGYAKKIAEAIYRYLTELRAFREQSLKAELERIKKK
jgi:DNA-binding transcriptional ArsR family regulator